MAKCIILTSAFIIWKHKKSYSFGEFLPEDWNDFVVEVFTGVTLY
jgi:hypothetical protein